MRSVIQRLAKSFLIPLELTGAVSGHNTTLIVSNKEMEDILEIFKSH